ncbi:MAG: recombinase family protein [Clostridia bacterium]|nr:recombinase family protein [Clostridia bacterium]
MEDKQKAGAYIRVENEDSMDAQKDAIERFAKNKGIDLLDFYIDNTSETVSLDNREGYLKLNEDIVSGKINTVITTSFEKFTGDHREKQGLMHNFAEKGVEIYIASTGEHMNPSDPITREQRLLAEAMRDMEETRAEQVRDRKKNNEKMH